MVCRTTHHSGQAALQAQVWLQGRTPPRQVGMAAGELWLLEGPLYPRPHPPASPPSLQVLCRCRNKAAATTARYFSSSCSCIRCSCGLPGIIAILKMTNFSTNFLTDVTIKILERVDGRHLYAPTECAESRKIFLSKTY